MFYITASILNLQDTYTLANLKHFCHLPKRFVTLKQSSEHIIELFFENTHSEIYKEITPQKRKNKRKKERPAEDIHKTFSLQHI